MSSWMIIISALILTENSETQAAIKPPESLPAKIIALTFDDGPRRGTTDIVLSELNKRKIKATFFVLGECIKGNEDLLIGEAENGMEIGNHTYDHQALTNLGQASIGCELDRTGQKIFDAAGCQPQIMRPPYGSKNDHVRKVVQDHGLHLTMWTLDPRDWKYRNSDYVANYVIKNAKNYDIVLLHDIHMSTALAVGRILDGLSEKGFRFVTVSELEKMRPKDAPRRQPETKIAHKKQVKRQK